MNLEKIRKQIEKDIVHAPDVRAHRDDLRDLINRAMRTLITSQRWNFRRRTIRLNLYADQALVSPSSLIDALTTQKLEVPRPAAWTDADVKALAGHVLHNGTDLADHASCPDGEYVIEKAENGATISKMYIYIDPRFTSWFGGAQPTGTLTIRFYRYLLPSDAADIFAVYPPDTAPLRGLSVARQDDVHNLTTVGPPQAFLNNQALISMAHSTYERGLANMEWRGQRNRGPQEDLTIATSGAVNAGILAGDYSFCYCWVHSGRVSPPSPVVTHTTIGGFDLTVTDWRALDSADYGRDRYLFRRFEAGPWTLDTILTDPSATTFASTAATKGAIDPTLTATYAELAEHRNYNYFRTWPRTDADKTYLVDYLVSARELVDPTDEPEFPEEHHPLLVHMVVQGLGARYGNKDLASTHRLLGGEVLVMMKRRYLDDSSHLWQKGQVGSSRRGLVYGTIEMLP